MVTCLYRCSTCKKAFASYCSFIFHQKSKYHNLSRKSFTFVAQSFITGRTKLGNANTKGSSHPYLEKFKCRRYHNSNKQNVTTTGNKSCMCCICGMTFNRPSTRINHEKHVHATTVSYACPFCNKVLKRKHSLQYHISNHKDIDDECHPLHKSETGKSSSYLYTCPLCVYTCENAPMMKRHIGTNHYSSSKSLQQEVYGQFTCPFCMKKLKSKYALQYHLTTHKTLEELEHQGNLTDKKPYMCSFCSFVSQLPLELKSHLDNMHANLLMDKQDFTCNICGRQLRSRLSLQEHKETHNDRAFACNDCDSTFHTETGLKRHIRRVHKCSDRNKNVTFPCEDCGKVLKTKSGYNSHRMIHTGQYNFVCSICNKNFRSKYNLETHLRSHTGEQPFACTICFQSFSDRANCAAHIKRKHKIEQMDANKIVKSLENTKRPGKRRRTDIAILETSLNAFSPVVAHVNVFDDNGIGASDVPVGDVQFVKSKPANITQNIIVLYSNPTT